MKVILSLHYQLSDIRKDLNIITYIVIHLHSFFVQFRCLTMDPPHLYIAAEKQWYTQNGPLAIQAIQVETKAAFV